MPIFFLICSLRFTKKLYRKGKLLIAITKTITLLDYDHQSENVIECLSKLVIKYGGFLFGVYRPTREFFTPMETSPLPAI